MKGCFKNVHGKTLNQGGERKEEREKKIIDIKPDIWTMPPKNGGDTVRIKTSSWKPASDS